MIGLLKLGCAALMTVAATVIIYLLDSRIPAIKNIPYMTKQIVIGVIFGIFAILGTEFGIDINGAMMNVRDAAPICAGLVFGGPAGIIAGVIGGVERWFAVYWGVGVYTQVACTVGTIVAGLFAAFVRKFMMEDRRPSFIYGLAVALVAEVFHMLMVFLTHMSAYEAAFTIVSNCGPVMITMNSAAVGLAVFIVNRLAKEKITLFTEKRSVVQIIEIGLLINVIIAFAITNVFVMLLQDEIAYTSAEKTLKYALDDITADFEKTKSEGENLHKHFDSALANRHVGDTGGIIIMDKECSIIAMTPVGDDFSEKYGASHGEFSMDSVQKKCYKYADQIERGASENPSMWSWYSGGVQLYVMIKDYGDYYLYGFYPKSEADIQKRTTQMITAYIIILILAALFIQIYVLIRSTVVRNVVRINDKLSRIAGGDLDVVMDIGGSEEFLSLSEDINVTVDALKHYIKDAETRINQELEYAKQIQYSSLNKEYPESVNFELYANMLAAKEVGGDFYDFYRFGEGECVFLIADVSGKGIPAAMFMMKAKTLINSLIDTGADMATVLTKANEELCKNNEADMFITAFIGKMNTRTGEIQCANAGHNRPVVVRKDGSTEYLKCRRGLVLAGMEGIRYKNEALQLEPGDSIYLYTDGVTEATDSCKAMYGEERLLEELAEVAHMSPRYMCRYIKRSIDEFVGDAPQFDDITMLAVRRKESNSGENELVIVPNEDSVTEVLGYVEKRTEALEIPLKTAAKAGVMVDEIYSNIVHYSGATIAKISCSVEEGSLVMTLKDNGVEYNPLEKEDPDISLSAEDREIGGLGIFMVKSIADDIKYERKNQKNLLKIIMGLN